LLILPDHGIVSQEVFIFFYKELLSSHKKSLYLKFYEFKWGFIAFYPM
jgi:hypothetical protein